MNQCIVLCPQPMALALCRHTSRTPQLRSLARTSATVAASSVCHCMLDPLVRIMHTFTCLVPCSVHPCYLYSMQPMCSLPSLVNQTGARAKPMSWHCGLQLCTGTRNRALTWAHSFMSTWSLPKSDSHLVLTEVSMDAGVLPGCAGDIAA
jgi:hypothetical protein